MDSKRYSIDEIADATALSVSHLTRAKGPLDRIRQTYYWIDDIVGPDRKDCSDFGLECLQDYLLQVGKKGDGSSSYTDWQQEIWQRYDRADALNASPGLVPVPKVEIVESSPTLASLRDSIGKFNQSLKDFDAHNAAVGKALGERVVTTIVENAESSINEGLSSFFNELSTLGKRN